MALWLAAFFCWFYFWRQASSLLRGSPACIERANNFCSVHLSVYNPYSSLMSNWTNGSSISDRPYFRLGAEGREASRPPRKSQRESLGWSTAKRFPKGMPPPSSPNLLLSHTLLGLPHSWRSGSCLASARAAGYLPRARCRCLSSVHPPPAYLATDQKTILVFSEGSSHTHPHSAPMMSWVLSSSLC